MKKGFRLAFSIIRTIVSLFLLVLAIMFSWLGFHINHIISEIRPNLGAVLLIIGMIIGIILFIISAYTISPIFWRELRYKAKLLSVKSQEEYKSVMEECENSTKTLKKFFIW